MSDPNIEIALGRGLRDLGSDVRYDRMIYTGKIDDYFDYMHGELPYRSLRFDFEFYDTAFRAVAQVNYPNEHSYTRTTEFKHATGQQIRGTTIAREFPQSYRRGENEPFYPIPLADAAELYSRYAAEAAKLSSSVLFAARLADFKHYNMEQAVARAR